MAEKVIIVREDLRIGWRVVGYALAGLVGVAALGGLGVLVARDQMTRHQKDLFSPHPLRRLAALGYLRSRPAVDNVLLLRDYLAWEERPMLQKRASAVLAHMEKELAAAESVEGA
jgi:hypothetical protein